MFNYETTVYMNDPGAEFGLAAFYVMGKLVPFLASVSHFGKCQ